MLAEYSFNPSSAHAAGKRARALIDESLSMLAGCLGTSPERITVTSGGTEAINQALRGYITPRRFEPHLLVSEGEHKAVIAAAAHYTEQDAAISHIPLDREGRPDIDKVMLDADKPPTMISVIYLSNETGALTDLERIAAWRDTHCPHAVIHVDAVQAAGKIRLDFDRSGCDFLSVSGHKWGAPMGLGLLLHKQSERLRPLISGAGQQRGLRSGTENAPLLAAAAFALKRATSQLAAYEETAVSLKQSFLTRLRETKTMYTLISPASALAHIVTIAFPLMGETMARILSDEGYLVGRGAACSAGAGHKNRALKALGIPEETARQAVRISFGPDNTPEDVLGLADTIHAALDRYGMHT